MLLEKTINSLQKNNYQVSFFSTINEAKEYLNQEISNTIVGFGDSMTLDEIKLDEMLAQNNTVYNPLKTNNLEEFIEVAKQCLTSNIFITSANAVAATGEIINIDGTGNRIAGSLFGHQKVYFVIGTNKIEDTLENAINRAKNIAATKNTKRLKLNTPCVYKENHCFNCMSKDRICNAMIIHFKKMDDIEMEVIIIDDCLGY